MDTKYIAIIAVLAVVIGLALLSVGGFFLVRRRRARKAAAPTMIPDEDVGTAFGGASELEEKQKPAVAELSGNGNGGYGGVAELDGYRGTAAPNSHGAVSELPGNGGYGYRPGKDVHEVDSTVRYELR
jgi:LPXTG-motif cell wall-anchored protein